ncbi:MAG: HEAT repeat domain-containing protein [bacterium]|nr:HEAT repeat domain-containing protein [bacterium]
MESPGVLYKNICCASEDKRPEITDSISKDQMSKWMSSSNWKVRNSAVKIAGEIRSEEYCEDLIRFLTDRTPASLFDRIFGGDFVQVGFIRRNAANSLAMIGHSSEIVSNALITAFGDPYWEVRTAAVRAFSILYKDNVPAKGLEKLKELLHDSKFEVVSETILVLGVLSDTPEILQSFRKFYSHSNSRVKIAVVRSLKKLYDRGMIKDEDHLRSELRNIFIPGHYKI